MTAPVPYSTSTKFATQIGTGLLGERIDRACGRCRSLPSRPRRSCRAVRSCAWNRFSVVAERRPPPALRPLLDERMLRREQEEVRAVDRVDAGGEDLDARRALGGSAGARTSGNVTRAPSERPIQFRCIVRTFSGHSGSALDAFEQLVGVCVIRKNHCSSSRVVDRACRSASRRRRRPARWRARSGSSGTS